GVGIYAEPRFLPCGDLALSVELGDDINREVNARVLALEYLIRQRSLTGVTETVPSYRSLLVYYDPLTVGWDDLTSSLHALWREARPEVLPPARTVEVPCCYEGELGFELEGAAEKLGLDPDEVARLHASADYYVYFVGFTPGLPYMTGMPERLNIPRLVQPRTKTPPGSVSIGGTQCCIYSVESPAASGGPAAPRSSSTIPSPTTPSCSAPVITSASAPSTARSSTASGPPSPRAPTPPTSNRRATGEPARPRRGSTDHCAGPGPPRLPPRGHPALGAHGSRGLPPRQPARGQCRRRGGARVHGHRSASRVRGRTLGGGDGRDHGRHPQRRGDAALGGLPGEARRDPPARAGRLRRAGVSRRLRPPRHAALPPLPLHVSPRSSPGPSPPPS